MTPVEHGKGMAVLPDRRRARASGWSAAAAFGLVWLIIVAQGPASLRRPPEERVVEAYLEAWHSGGYDTAMSLRAPQSLRVGPPEDRARAESAYQAALGADVALHECEELPPRTLRCDVSYSNALNREVGKGPAMVSLQFGIAGGRVEFVAGPYLEDEVLSDSFRRFALDRHPEAYDEACHREPGYQQPDCARFKLAHLAEWARWRLVEG